jgi:AcrR family transcriptional regulator
VAAQAGRVASRRDSRERHILDTAARLFREQGYASTTTRDISATAGINSATPNYYFGTKAAILFRIYEETFDALESQLDSVQNRPPYDALVTIIRAGVVETATHPDYVAVFFQEFRWLDRHLDPKKASALRGRQARFIRRICGLIEDGVRAGVFRPVDPQAAASHLIGVAAWTYQWYRPGRPESPDTIAERCVDLAFHGLLHRQSPR